MNARCARVLTVVIGFAVADACGKSPAQPGTPVLLNSIQIGGPSSLVPGTTGRYSATAKYTDGSSRDVTAAATWEPPGGCGGCPVSFPSPGVGSANRPGETVVKAWYQSAASPSTGTVSAELQVLVLEPGTFKLSGSITEAGGGPIFGVVDVVSGTGAGFRATGSGSYAVYGVAGTVQLRTSSLHYTTQVRDVVVTGNGATSDFALVPVETPSNVAGEWTLTLVSPSSSCPAGLPLAAQGRSYNVNLSQLGTRLQVAISSPTLQVKLPELNSGLVLGARVLLSFEEILDDFTGRTSPNLLDQLTPTETFSFSGVINGAAMTSEIVGPMSGKLMYWKGPTDVDPTWVCKAEDHGVILRRR